MAMYRLSASVISRSQGRSSIAAAAYRAGEKLHNLRDGKDYDYSKRAGVLHTEIVMPVDAPAGFDVREDLWNAVEEAEKRKDAQLARELQLALPHELDEGAHVDLVRAFVEAEFVEKGMIADVAIHAAGVKGDHRNVHAHVMLTTRTVGSAGFEGKNRDWNAKELLGHWRESWGAHVNGALEAADVVARVDHRSLEDQREGHLEESQAALDVQDYNSASLHTVEAEKLNREPRVYLKREDYQRAQKDPSSYAGQILRHSYEVMSRAHMRAEEMLSGFKELIVDGLDRLDGLVAKLRGPEPSMAGGGVKPKPRKVESSYRERSQATGSERLNQALDGLQRASLTSGGLEAEREAARQARLEEEERLRLERERLEVERKAELERKAEEQRLKEERENSRKYDGPDFSM